MRGFGLHQAESRELTSTQQLNRAITFLERLTAHAQMQPLTDSDSSSAKTASHTATTAADTIANLPIITAAATATSNTDASNVKSDAKRVDGSMVDVTTLVIQMRADHTALVRAHASRGSTRNSSSKSPTKKQQQQSSQKQQQQQQQPRRPSALKQPVKPSPR